MTPLLELQNVSVWFSRRSSRASNNVIKAVSGVSFAIPKGGTLGLVGESGSGKTTVGKALLKLVPVTSGRILVENTDVTALSERRFRPYRRRLQMIFQDPYSSLNPRWSVLQIIAEPLQIYFPALRRRERVERVSLLLRKVGLNPDHMRRYPHEFSGGQRQRIGIARALAVEPELIVCDEPVSALDVSVQAQIINLLQDLQEQLGLSYLFIAHDLAIVEHVSSQLAVMYRGQIVEAGDAKKLARAPEHAYTQKLLASVPTLS